MLQRSKLKFELQQYGVSRNEFCIICSQAFAWFSDLLVEHAEIFWALFAVDMDRILAEQPPDTWDTFQLFQILNDYLRLDGTLLISKN